MNETEWILLCPVYGNKTRDRIRKDTEQRTILSTVLNVNRKL